MVKFQYYAAIQQKNIEYIKGLMRGMLVADKFFEYTDKGTLTRSEVHDILDHADSALNHGNPLLTCADPVYADFLRDLAEWYNTHPKTRTSKTTVISGKFEEYYRPSQGMINPIGNELERLLNDGKLCLLKKRERK